MGFLYKGNCDRIFSFFTLWTHKFSVHRSNMSNLYVFISYWIFATRGRCPLRPRYNFFWIMRRKNRYFFTSSRYYNILRSIVFTEIIVFFYSFYAKEIIWLVELYFSKVFSLNVYVIWVENNLSNGVFI